MTTSEYLLTAVSALLQVLLLSLIVRRGLYRRLPIFSVYMGLVLAFGPLLWWSYRRWGYGSLVAYYVGWTAQGVTFLTRTLAIAEICRSSLKNYRGIWGFSKRLLLGTAGVLLFYAALDARRQTHKVYSFVLTAERGLEFAAVVVLVVLFLFCRYYRVRLQPLQWMISLGLCFYSAVQVLNDSFLRDWVTQYLFSWNSVRMVSFQVALVIWLLALAKPLPAESPAPVLLEQDVYDELVPQVNLRLRLLNERLLELLRS